MTSFISGLQKILSVILEEVFKPILTDILEVFINYFMSVIWSMWSEWLLGILAIVCSLVDFVENIFNVFAGISPVTVGEKSTYLLDAFFQMEKVTALRRLIDERNPSCELEVDGGVAPDTCQTCIDAGANVLVAGSAVYKAADIPARIQELRGR